MKTKTTHKLFALSLAILLLIGVLSIAASAVTTISSVSVTGVTAPVAGATASWDFTIPSGQGYSKYFDSDNDCGYWLESDTYPTVIDERTIFYYKSDGSFTFKPDKCYTFAAFIKADSGYDFATKLSATLNNTATTVYRHAGAYVEVWYFFGNPAPPISSVTVTGVTAPVTGATASWDFTIPSGAGYSKYASAENNYGYWSETSTEPTSISDVVAGSARYKSSGSFTFRADKYYTFVAWIKADSGYAFSTNPSGAINNKSAFVSKTNGYIRVWYCFGKPATPINSVSVTGVTAPVAGATASWNYTIPSGAGYSKYAASYNNYGYWSETSATPTNYADVVNGSKKYVSNGSFTFKADKYYTFVAWVKPDSGYQITSSTRAMLSGDFVNITSSGTGYYHVWYCFSKPATPISSVAVTGVTAPVTGAAASFDWSIPSGAGYEKAANSLGDNCMWMETPTPVTDLMEAFFESQIYTASTGSFTFNPDKYYTFFACIDSKPGYAFGYNTSSTINNNKALTEKAGYGFGERDIVYYFGKPAAKTLSSISVTAQPTKKAYTAGDAFNKSGMIVTASYSNSNPAAVTSYTVSNGSKLTCNQKTVTLSYTEDGITKTTTVPVTVAHKTVTIPGYEADCTSTGLTDGEKCSVCGTVTKAQTTVKALGHKEGYGSDFAAPECEYDGVTEEIICERCEIVLKPAKTIPATGHSYKTTTTKATTSKDGKTVKTCENCSKKVTTTIYKVTSFKLSTTSYAYDGKAKTPSVTVKDSKGKTLKKDTDYTVKYASGRKSVGKYTVTVTLKGKYSGTKSLSFTINPKATSKITVTQTTTSIKATWSKVSGATGYKVYIYKGSKLVASKTVSAKTTSYNFTKLTAGTNYTVKVKAYQTVSKVNYWSSTKSLATATKTKTPSITSVKAGSKSATVKWSNVSGENGYQVYYATSKSGTYKKGATTKTNDVDATIKSLTKGKTYYFKVRAYKTADSGTVYSAWSAVKSVKVK